MERLFLVITVVMLAGCPLGRGSKKVGESCSHANDCAEARCSEKSRICTKACKGPSDCEGGLVCDATTNACEKP